jgi:WD40 repeat protein
MSDSTITYRADDEPPSPIDKALAEFIRSYERDRSLDIEQFLAGRSEGFDLQQAIEDYNAEQIRRTSPEKFWLGMQFGTLRLESQLGIGGLGIVYKARLTDRTDDGQVLRDCAVALKFPLRSWSAGQREMFLRESRNAAALNHPQIVKILDAGERYGHCYIVMEFVAGRTISQLLETEGAPSLDCTLTYFRQLAEGIAYAHEQNIYHRDLKPNNVMLDAFDAPRVIDFSLAKQLGTDRDLTCTQQAIGAGRYAPPEYLDRKLPQDPARSDVYGLGTVLYELLTGQKLFFEFDDKRPPLSQPQSPCTVRPSIPRDLSAICEDCLAPLAALRYPSMAKVLEDLDRYEQHLPLRHRRATRAHRLRLWCRRHRRSVLACLLTMLVLAIVLGVHRAFERAGEDSQRLAYRNDLAAAEAALEETNLPQAERLLDRWIPADGTKDRRGWEWHYLQGQTHQELESFPGGAGQVVAVSWQPGAPCVACASDAGILLKNFARTTPDRTLAGHSQVAWCPNGKYLAAGGPEWRLHLFEPERAADPLTLTGHGGVVEVVAWNPSGTKLASGAHDGSIIVWDIASRRAEQTLAAGGRPVTALTFSPDGAQLTFAVEETVKLWTLADGQFVRELTRQPNVVSSLSWHPTRSRLAITGHPTNVIVLDPATGERVAQLRHHQRAPLALAWSPDGKLLVSGGDDQKIVLWDAVTFEPLHTLRGHRESVRALAWSPTGEELCSGSADGTVCHWRVEKTQTQTWTPVVGRQPHAWSPDRERLALAGREPDVRVYRRNVSEPVMTLPHPHGVVAIGWNPNGRQLATASIIDQKIRIWDVETGSQATSFQSPPGQTHVLAWSPTGNAVAIAGENRSIVIWNRATGRCSAPLAGHSAAVTSLAWSADGADLASASADGRIGLWDSRRGVLVKFLEGHSATVTTLAWSGDGEWLVSGSLDRTLRLWNPATGALHRVLEAHLAGIRAVAFSPAGDRIASGGEDSVVKIWDRELAGELFALRAGGGAIQGLAWTPDNRELAAYSIPTDRSDGQWVSTVHRWQAAVPVASAARAAPGNSDAHLQEAIWEDPFAANKIDSKRWKIGREQVELRDQSVTLVDRGYLVTQAEYPTGVALEFDWQWIDHTDDPLYGEVLTVVLRSGGVPRAARPYEVIDGLMVKLNASKGSVIVQTVADGEILHTSPAGAVPMPAGRWHRVRIVDQQRQLRIDFNGERVLSLPYTQTTSQARIAIYNREWVAGTHESRIDNVKLAVPAAPGF